MLTGQSRFYYCYSYRLKKYLRDNNEYVVIKGIHPETLKRYWVFERNEHLDELLTKWNDVKE